jgi:hypothetical protein
LEKIFRVGKSPAEVFPVIHKVKDQTAVNVSKLLHCASGLEIEIDILSEKMVKDKWI